MAVVASLRHTSATPAAQPAHTFPVRRVLRFFYRYARPYLPHYLLGLALLFATNYAVVEFYAPVRVRCRARVCVCVARERCRSDQSVALFFSVIETV